MKKWFRRGLKALGLGVVLIALVSGIWWVRQPHLPEDHVSTGSFGGAAELQAPMEASRRWAGAIADSLDLPSLSLAASVDGEVVWMGAVGYADIRTGRRATSGTRYRTGSIAKALTSVVLADAVGRGIVTFDQTVGSILGDAAGTASGATLRQLAGHQGGVRHYRMDDPATIWAEQASQRHFERSSDALELFVEDSLLFEPGQGFGYSTHGYTLLGAALEGATGRGFIELLESAVSAPLGLVGTGPDDVRQKGPERATTYVRLRNRFVDPLQADPSYKWPGGGLLSTPSDLVRVGGALMTGALVDRALVEELWTPQLMADGRMNPQRYGMGWRIESDRELLGTPDSLRVVHHGGSIVGGSSFLLLVPERGVAVAAMSNLSLSGRDASRLRAAVFRIAGAFAQAR